MSVVAEVVHKRPDLSYREIGKAFGIGQNTVLRYANRAGVGRGRSGFWRRKKRNADGTWQKSL